MDKENKFIPALGIIIFAATIYIYLKLSSSNRVLIPLSFVPLIAGLLIEYGRITKSRKAILRTFLISYCFSFLAFGKGKGMGAYSFEEHIRLWPFLFIGIFILITLIFYFDNLVIKLSDGMTLLYSISIAYWIIGNHYWDNSNMAVKVLIIASIPFILFSLVHGFTYIPLTKQTKFILSLWGSLIVLVLSIDNIYQIFNSPGISTNASLSQNIYIALQYFLLGTSSIYIVQNVIIIGAALPTRAFDFSSNNLLLQRFSGEQDYKMDCFFAAFISITAFSLNYYFNFLPANIMIWIVIAVFPFLLAIFYRIFG